MSVGGREPGPDPFARPDPLGAPDPRAEADAFARMERETDTRSPRWTLWIGTASLFVVMPLLGWAEERAYVSAHGAPPAGLSALVLWILGLGR